jgi:chemotaxis protein histidine kinase CheA
VLEEHLNNAQVYQNFTHEMDNTLDDLQNEFFNFLNSHSRNLPDTTREIFSRSETIHGWKKVAQFRATAKVHKNPVKLRPVVAKCNTAIECLSKWLDVEFQKLVGYSVVCQG